MAANVLCIKWGSLYGSDYVNRLFYGVRKHLRQDHRFVCLTDNPFGIDRGVEVYPLPETGFDEAAFDARKGGATWRKIGLFQPGLADLQGDILYLDLDAVITEPLDEFFQSPSGKFCVPQDWSEKWRAWIPGRSGHVGNTSVFRYNLAEHAHVYAIFAADPQRALQKFRVEQQFVSHVLRDQLEFWPTTWVQSFRHHCCRTFPWNLVQPPKKPEKARIVVFPGHPLPDQAIAGHSCGLLGSTLPAPWLADYWNDQEPRRISRPEISRAA